MIRINCFFKANEGGYNAALEAAVALTAKSLQHSGCVAYDVFESATRPDVFSIIETWQDQASLDKHSNTPEFKEYVGKMEENGTLSVEVMQK